MRRRSFYLIVLLAVIAYPALTLLPIGPRTGTYLAADDTTDRYSVKPYDWVVVNVPRFSNPPLFRIENGRLYLLVQDHRHALLITTIVGSSPHWTSDALKRFRGEHPELEAYWPKPQEPDAGVAWLGERF